MVQNRGEYLYAACGEDGVRVFDIAFIDDKALLRADHDRPGVAGRARSSTCRRKYATYVAAPTTVAVDPTRTQMPGEQGTADPPAVRLPVHLPTSTRG